MPGPKICQAAAGSRIRRVTRKPSNGLAPIAHRTIQATRPTVSATSVVIRRGSLQREGGGEVFDHLAHAVRPALAGGPDHAAADDDAVGHVTDAARLLAGGDAEANRDGHLR